MQRLAFSFPLSFGPASWCIFLRMFFKGKEKNIFLILQAIFRVSCSLLFPVSLDWVFLTSLSVGESLCSLRCCPAFSESCADHEVPGPPSQLSTRAKRFQAEKNSQEEAQRGRRTPLRQAIRALPGPLSAPAPCPGSRETIRVTRPPPGSSRVLARSSGEEAAAASWVWVPGGAWSAVRMRQPSGLSGSLGRPVPSLPSVRATGQQRALDFGPSPFPLGPGALQLSDPPPPRYRPAGEEDASLLPAPYHGQHFQ